MFFYMILVTTYQISCSQITNVGLLQSVAYAENFHGWISFSGIWWSFVFGVRPLWRHNLTSYSCFPTNVLAKFVDIYAYFSTSTPLILCVIAQNTKY